MSSYLWSDLKLEPLKLKKNVVLCYVRHALYARRSRHAGSYRLKKMHNFSSNSASKYM